MRLLWQIVGFVVSLGLLAGCGGSGGGSGGGGGGHENRPTAVNTKDLPKLGDYLPPLDGDRIQLAPPEGWYVPSASSEYVVRVQKSDTEKYPSVILTAEDYDGVANVSRKNVKEFAAEIAQALKKSESAVRPMEVGSFVGAAYAKRVQVKTPVTRILDLLYLETVVAGRKYRFELRSEEGSSEEDRPYLLAVVQGTKFLRAEPAAIPKQASGQKPEQAPEEKPAEAPRQAEKVKEKAEEAPKQAPKKGPEQEAKEKPKKEARPKEEPKKEAKEPPKAKETEKKKPKEGGGLELDLDKLDELLK